MDSMWHGHDMSGLDVPLLRKKLEHVTAHPEELNQGIHGVRTACGTAACVAGHLVLGDSASTVNWYRYGDEATLTLIGSVDVEIDGIVYTNVEVEDRAAELLGVPWHSVSSRWKGNLFNDENTLEDLWRIAGEMSGGQIQPPEGLRSA